MKHSKLNPDEQELIDQLRKVDGGRETASVLKKEFEDGAASKASGGKNK